MAYHTSVYLFLFLPIALLLYQLTPKKGRWITLLLTGYIFFWIVSGKLVAYLIGTTLFTHYIAVWLAWTKEQGKLEIVNLSKEEARQQKKNIKKKEKAILIFGIVVLLLILAYLKYYNFFVQNMNSVLAHLGRESFVQTRMILLPIGISFYTLQAIGYMVDVYWGKVEVYKHPGKLALFLSFFPQIMEGPISMYSQTADMLWAGNSLTGDNLSKGSGRILWGLFKKMIIADRLYVLVQVIFENYANYHGVMIIVAAISYTVQLYMEFSGCMDIIIGSGKMFGVILPENFNQPFFAKNAAEFWRRWHISLGVWFKTYIFYSVSVSAVVKKWNKFGKLYFGKYITKLGVSAICLFPVWLCNGLWHGARWSYIFYGMYYFIILLGEIAVEPVKKKILEIIHLNEENLYFKIFQILKTWVIIIIGELFFRANGLRAGVHMFKSIFTEFECSKLWDGTLLTLGLDKADYFAIIVGCMTVIIVGIIKERNWLGENGLQKICLPVRWTLYYGLIFAVVILGAYGIGYQQVDMIYAGF